MIERLQYTELAHRQARLADQRAEPRRDGVSRPHQFDVGIERPDFGFCAFVMRAQGDSPRQFNIKSFRLVTLKIQCVNQSSETGYFPPNWSGGITDVPAFYLAEQGMVIRLARDEKTPPLS